MFQQQFLYHSESVGNTNNYIQEVEAKVKDMENKLVKVQRDQQINYDKTIDAISRVTEAKRQIYEHTRQLTEQHHLIKMTETTLSAGLPLLIC